MNEVVALVAATIKADFEAECAAVREAGMVPHGSLRARSQYAARVAADGFEAAVVIGAMPGPFNREEFYAACGI